MKSIVRPTTADDAPAISALLWEAGLRPNARSGDLQWKYWDGLQGSESRSFVLMQGAELMAHAGVIPRTYAYGSQRLRVLHVIDWAARRNAVGAGVSLMKQLRRFGDVLLSVGGSSHTLGILPYIGFASHGSGSTFVLPLHPLRILQPSVNRPAWKLLPRLGRNLLWMLSAPRPRADGWEVRRVDAESVQSLTSVLPRPTRTLAVLERTPQLLAHMLNCPISPMRLYLLDQNGRTRGYFLLAHPPAQVRLADCWIDSDVSADWRALIDCAICQARDDHNAAELVAYSSDPTLLSCLQQAGFHLRGVQPIRLLVRPGVNVSSAPLRVQLLDNDAAYHHVGKPEFAA